MLYAGLDVHARSIVGCIVNADGKRIKEFVHKGDAGRALLELAALPERVQVCYEASCGYGNLFDQLAKLPNVARIAVAHPGQLRLIFRSKRKNDRVDAAKLAKLLYLDQVPQVHVPNLDVRAWRAVIEFRRKLVDKQTMTKNQIRALLRTHGVAAPHRRALWTVRGLAWLAQLEWPTPLVKFQLEALLDELVAGRRRLKDVEHVLNRIGAAHAGVRLLRTIPGVGPRTAEAFLAYVDQPKRFGRSKQIGAYFGLVPQQDQSAGPSRFGHITREGPATVRKLLTEAAWQGVRRSPQIRAFFERVRRGDPGRSKIALVATAHWLARVMLALLRSGRPAHFTRYAKPNATGGAPATTAPAATVPTTNDSATTAPPESVPTTTATTAPGATAAPAAAATAITASATAPAA